MTQSTIPTFASGMAITISAAKPAGSDHAPPHFEALYAEHEAAVDIGTLEVIEGSRFLDGLEGVVDMSALAASSNAGVFAALADHEAFSRAFVALGAVCWPGCLDIAPDAIYAEIKAGNSRECALS